MKFQIALSAPMKIQRFAKHGTTQQLAATTARRHHRVPHQLPHQPPKPAPTSQAREKQTRTMAVRRANGHARRMARAFRRITSATGMSLLTVLTAMMKILISVRLGVLAMMALTTTPMDPGVATCQNLAGTARLMTARLMFVRRKATLAGFNAQVRTMPSAATTCAMGIHPLTALSALMKIQRFAKHGTTQQLAATTAR